MGAEVSEPRQLIADPLVPGEAKPKAKRASRAKKEATPTVPVDPLVPGEAKPKAKRASRAKPRQLIAAPPADATAEALPDLSLGNVAMPELTREVSFSFGMAEEKADVKAAPKPRKAKAKVDTEPPALAESPKWLKFKADVEEGKFDALREDGGFHPGKLSIRVSGVLATNPEWRPLVAELLRSRGRFEVMRVFGL